VSFYGENYTQEPFFSKIKNLPQTASKFLQKKETFPQKRRICLRGNVLFQKKFNVVSF